MLGELTAIRENGTTPLVTFAYNDLGQRTSLTRANGTTTTYGYDAIARLTSLAQDLGGTGQDLALGFGYNPANQIAGSTRSNDLYAWAGHYNVDRPYAINGLNQVTAAGGVTPVYDNKGNMRSGAGMLYDYNVDNLLSQVTPSDPAQPTLRFNYAATGELESIGDHLGFEYLDGQMITEVSDAPGFPIQRRYIFGPGADEPLVWYEGGGTTQKYWLHADERGSVVAVTDASGNAVGTNSYDEYGIPAANNMGRFQYTGQIWVPEIGLYYYKARMYSPTYGRFMQTDPIGYGAGVNMYGYVGADPINGTDPSGTQDDSSTIVVTGNSTPRAASNFGATNASPPLMLFKSPYITNDAIAAALKAAQRTRRRTHTRSIATQNCRTGAPLVIESGLFQLRSMAVLNWIQRLMGRRHVWVIARVQLRSQRTSIERRISARCTEVQERTTGFLAMLAILPISRCVRISERQTMRLRPLLVATRFSHTHRLIGVGLGVWTQAQDRKRKVTTRGAGDETSTWLGATIRSGVLEAAGSGH